MKYETYEKICDKHKINPLQVIADGNIREILERDRGHNLEFHEILLDQENLYRITIKPEIWFSFKGLHNPFSLINNVSNLIHDDKEVGRKDLHAVNYL